jgi:NAD(P)H dehydrogenase (quinone)
MNVLIVFAHPEHKSLNGSLLDFMVRRFESGGHTVQVSDLYEMKWKPALDADDFLNRELGTPFDAMRDSKRAYVDGSQTADIAREQEKLLWADAVVMQFPLYWYSMPAIMKGWVERVYAYTFAYGIGEHSEKRWGDRFGEGKMAGKRAMLLVTAGGWESHYSPRGVNGPMDDLLFPIQHGILYYPGFDVLPPFVAYKIGQGRVDAARYESLTETLGTRIDAFWTTTPIAFRQQNAGDYEIPALTLRPEIAPGQVGFAAHVRNAAT